MCDVTMLAGMLLEHVLVRIGSGEVVMNLLTADQSMLLEHSYPSWPTRASC